MPSHATDDSVHIVPVNTKAYGGMLVFIALTTSGLSACGSDPSLRVDGSVLERMTIENKLLLFDAENELDIAIDDRDQVVDRLSALQIEKRRVEDRRKRAAADLEFYKSKNDSAQSGISALRTASAVARLKHLEAETAAQEVRLERQERALIVARARFELAKARLVRRNNVPGAAKLNLADFEKQVERYQSRVAALAPKLEAAEARVAQREDAWSQAAARLRDASGGAYGSRWVE